LFSSFKPTSKITHTGAKINKQTISIGNFYFFKCKWSVLLVYRYAVVLLWPKHYLVLIKEEFEEYFKRNINARI